MIGAWAGVGGFCYVVDQYAGRSSGIGLWSLTLPAIDWRLARPDGTPVKGDFAMGITSDSQVEVSLLVERTARALLASAPKGSEVILFGSHARGTAGEHSDADFLVVEPSVEDPWAESVRLRRVVARIPLAMDLIVIGRERFEAERNERNGLVAEAAKGRVYRHEG
jgi:predicted nucleotidyltransferase